MCRGQRTTLKMKLDAAGEMRSNRERRAAGDNSVEVEESKERKREKSDESVWSELCLHHTSPCSAVNGFDCEHEGEKAKSRRTHEGRKCVCACVPVCLCCHLTKRINCLLTGSFAKLNNLMSVHQEAISLISLIHNTHLLSSPVLPLPSA